MPADVREVERVMLGLRLDEPLAVGELGGRVDLGQLARLEALGLAEQRGGTVTLTRRGRFLGDDVTATLLA